MLWRDWATERKTAEMLRKTAEVCRRPTIVTSASWTKKVNAQTRGASNAVHGNWHKLASLLSCFNFD